MGNKEHAEELLRKAAESQSLEEGSGNGGIGELWANADTDRKVMYCFIVVGLAFVVIGIPALIIRQMVLADRASSAMVDNLVGEKQLEFNYTWADRNGKQSPPKRFTTTETPLRAEHSSEGWTVTFFGREWKGKTSELSEMSIFCPLADISALARDVDLEEKEHSSGLTLSVVKESFRIMARVPTSRVSAEGSHLVIRDNFGGTREAGTPPPSDAIITSREERNDSSGSMTTVKYKVTAREGFSNFTCAIATGD